MTSILDCQQQPLPIIEVVECENEHWRWTCSCGSKGIRLWARADAERLALVHLRRHGVVLPKTQRDPNRARVIRAWVEHGFGGRFWTTVEAEFSGK